MQVEAKNNLEKPETVLSIEVVLYVKEVRALLDTIRTAPLLPDSQLPQLSQKQLDSMIIFVNRKVW